MSATPNFADRDGVIWLDGELVPWREAKVHVLTHTLHYGLGVFEGVRAYLTPDRGTAVFRLKEHTDRLFRSAHILRMDMPFDKDTLNEAQRTVVRENGLSEAYLRPMCFLGSEGMGLRADSLKTHVMVAAWEWPSYMDPEARNRGIKVRTSSYTRHHVNITMCKAKANGNYINSMLALREALDAGAEEALQEGGLQQDKGCRCPGQQHRGVKLPQRALMGIAQGHQHRQGRGAGHRRGGQGHQHRLAVGGIAEQALGAGKDHAHGDHEQDDAAGDGDGLPRQAQGTEGLVAKGEEQ